MSYRTVRQKLADQRSEEIREEGLDRLKAIRESIPCPACEEAEGNPMSGHFRAKCLECSARAIAGGPTFWEAAQRQKFTSDYERLMRTQFGESWSTEWHPRVKEWARKMAEARVIL
jgi:hypothetical protein